MTTEPSTLTLKASVVVMSRSSAFCSPMLCKLPMAAALASTMVVAVDDCAGSFGVVARLHLKTRRLPLAQRQAE